MRVWLTNQLIGNLFANRKNEKRKKGEGGRWIYIVECYLLDARHAKAKCLCFHVDRAGVWLD